VTTEFFSPPDGEIIQNPQLDWLKDLILNKGEDYWNAGAGQASLKRHENGATIELLLTLEPSQGFYLEYIDPQNVYYVSLGEGTFDKTVTVYVGGDPVLLPTAFFISRKLALAAVEELCSSGCRTTKITWKQRRDVKWNYGCESE
jgi:hypothetical protein